MNDPQPPPIPGQDNSGQNSVPGSPPNAQTSASPEPNAPSAATTTTTTTASTQPPPAGAAAGAGAAISPKAPHELLENASVWHLVDAVLRRPGSLADYARRGPGQMARVAAVLLATAVVSLAFFGFLVGRFSNGDQLWASPVKFVMIGVFSSLLCLPSLYIFAALAGRELDLRGAVGAMLAILARSSLLLLGFAPLAWIFAESTTSLVFYGSVVVFLGLVSTLVGLGFFASSRSGAGSGYLVLWAGVFLLVTLQMPTSLRPLVGTADTFLPKEKRFFLTHWLQSADDQQHQQRESNRKEREQEQQQKDAQKHDKQQQNQASVYEIYPPVAGEATQPVAPPRMDPEPDQVPPARADSTR